MAYPTFKFPCVPDFVWICFPPSLRLSTFFKNGWETVHTGTRPMKTCCVLVLHHVRGVSFWIRFLLEWKKIGWKSSSRFHLPGKFCLSDGVIFFCFVVCETALNINIYMPSVTCVCVRRRPRTPLASWCDSLTPAFLIRQCRQGLDVTTVLLFCLLQSIDTLFLLAFPVLHLFLFFFFYPCLTVL